jgi:hypothetical protein
MNLILKRKKRWNSSHGRRQKKGPSQASSPWILWGKDENWKKKKKKEVYHKFKVLSRYSGVTIDGVLIGYWIY